MSMRVHVGKVVLACLYHLRGLRQLRFILTRPMMQRLASAFILSRLDYCNTVLVGLPAITLAPLQRVMNAAVRLVTGLEWRDHVVSAVEMSQRAAVEGGGDRLEGAGCQSRHGGCSRESRRKLVSSLRGHVMR